MSVQNTETATSDLGSEPCDLCDRSSSDGLRLCERCTELEAIVGGDIGTNRRVLELFGVAPASVPRQRAPLVALLIIGRRVFHIDKVRKGDVERITTSYESQGYKVEHIGELR